MATTISRTWYNTLQDDDGTLTTGTVWDKAAVDSLLDAIDALLAGNLVLGGSINAPDGFIAATGGGLYRHSVISGSGTDYSPSLFAETGLSLYFMTNGSVTIKAKLDPTGDWYTNDGTVSSLSDGRLKTLVRPFMAGLKEVCAIQPSLGVYRHRVDVSNVKAPMSNHEFVSLCAQDVQPYIPEAVKTDEQGWFTMKAQPIMYALINSAVELDRRLSALEAMAR